MTRGCRPQRRHRHGRPPRARQRPLLRPPDMAPCCRVKGRWLGGAVGQRPPASANQAVLGRRLAAATVQFKDGWHGGQGHVRCHCAVYAAPWPSEMWYDRPTVPNLASYDDHSLCSPTSPQPSPDATTQRGPRAGHRQCKLSHSAHGR